MSSTAKAEMHPGRVLAVVNVTSFARWHPRAFLPTGLARKQAGPAPLTHSLRGGAWRQGQGEHAPCRSCTAAGTVLSLSSRTQVTLERRGMRMRAHPAVEREPGSGRSNAVARFAA